MPKSTRFLSANAFAGNLEIEGLALGHGDDETQVALFVKREVDDALGGTILRRALDGKLVGIEGDELVVGNELVVFDGLYELAVLGVHFNPGRHFFYGGCLVDGKFYGLVVADVEHVVHAFVEIEVADAVFVVDHGDGGLASLGVLFYNLLRPLCLNGEERCQQECCEEEFFHIV